MRLRLSVRIWQTALFVIVVLVAIGMLWLMLMPALENRLEQSAAEEQLRDAASVAAAARPAFPVSSDTEPALRADVVRLRNILGDDIWVFDAEGNEVAGVHPRPLSDYLLEEALAELLVSERPWVDVDIHRSATAGRVISDASGRRVGAVLVSRPFTSEHALLETATARLGTTFWIAALVAGALGLLFSDVISRRVRLLNSAARAIAEGDFAQRLPRSFMPDDVRELADEYNAMAERLGEAFGALADREQQIAAVVRSMAEGILALDAAGNVSLVNKAAERVLLMRAEDILGHSVGEALRDGEVTRLAREALEGRAASDTLSLGRRVLRVHASPLLADEEVRGAVLLVSDITQQTMTEDAQRRFIATASHEMRTPIAAMKGFLELLRGPARDDDGVREDFLRTMQLEVERLNRLVTELFMLAQIDSGHMQVDMRPQSFTEVVGDVVMLMRTVAEEAHVLLRHELPQGDLCVLADRDRLVQALIALVDNAVKHAHGGEVVLRARIERPDLLVEVADCGEGIPADALPHLFDRFYRVEHSKAHGAGLGLAIVKEIVESHGGFIEVESEPGYGAVFRFSLPLTSSCERRSNDAA